MVTSARICSSLKPQVSDSEWQARLELAAFYRIVFRYGWSQLVNNHITLRVPGTTDQFLLNPHGLSYDEITASSLMKINAQGEVVLKPDHGLGINYTGFVIHGAVHKARPELHCIAHTHTHAGIAVATSECGLLMLNNSALFLLDTVAYHDYEGPSLDLAEQERLIRDLGTNDVMILRNHGLLACGRTVAEAFLNLHSLETSCRIQLEVLATGKPVRAMSEAAIDSMRSAMSEYRNSRRIGQLEWAAEKRWLDRNDPTYSE
jgi:ribulose-5-phosphate 4-epimerase/fuculose-1-phosphate aldolase